MGIAVVSFHESADIAGIWVAFFSRWQRYRCQQGWGWGNPTESYARGNAITYNRVDRANQRLADGGSVYTLSAQPGSTIAYNYVSNQRLRDSPLYHDGGSAGFHDHHNVYRMTISAARDPRGSPTGGTHASG